MLNHYETVFITTPVLSEQQIKEAVEKFKNTITDNGGTIEHEEAWGLRKLAYPIQKKTTGFYHCYSLKQKVHWLTNWKPLTDVTRELFVF